MTLTELKYIVAVARESTGKGADLPRQPADLSVAIKKLEEELRVAVSSASSAKLVTPLGEESSARQSVLEQTGHPGHRQARQDPLAGPLRLGVITIGAYLLPDLVRQAIRLSRKCR
jgi:DNA-binding transcriptional LysR family regulator